MAVTEENTAVVAAVVIIRAAPAGHTAATAEQLLRAQKPEPIQQDCHSILSDRDWQASIPGLQKAAEEAAVDTAETAETAVREPQNTQEAAEAVATAEMAAMDPMRVIIATPHTIGAQAAVAAATAETAVMADLHMCLRLQQTAAQEEPEAVADTVRAEMVATAADKPEATAATAQVAVADAIPEAEVETE